ncbi:unnamed protein product [Mytilus coruscus]|uniref:HSPA12B n=1 Tax=Mytilus coruscus TaxID=42192 RepID=A0A6J8E6N9_MYTCO|nr:unnamed protein product [Mytilus coruscus]
MASQSAKILVAAIDFGTTYSGYAFSFRHDFEQDACKISSHNWPAASRGLVSLKTPTSILLNPQEEFDCFGYDAEDRYTALANEDLHKNWFYFRRFKMMLHGSLGIKRDVKVKTFDSQKELPAMKIFSVAIKYLKDHLMETLNKRNTGVRRDDIQWVLTVPAIWNDPAKQFMREAAEKAGIDDLIISLEPEAASLFCKYMPIEKGTDDFKTFQPGNKYIVLDCGGGTVDITVHQVQQDKTLKELFKASGGAWGGTQVDEAFKQLIIKIVGSPVYLNFCEKNAADFVDMFREFELKKRGFSGEGNKQITIKIPVSLQETFEEDTGETIQEVLGQTSLSGKLKWAGDKLRISSILFATFFDKATTNIIEHLKKLLKEPEVEGTTNIIMVGGFSESPLIQKKVKEEFPKMHVLIPAEAGLSVLKGAVIFGHLPKTISSRKAKYTYGLATMTKFIKGKHREDKKETIGNQVKCKDIFSIHVEKGQTLELDEAQSDRSYNPVDPEQKEIIFQFYISDSEDPMYVTDSGCTHIGKMEVKIPDTSGGLDRQVTVQLIFGGTELKVKAIIQKTKKEVIAKLQFLDKD